MDLAGQMSDFLAVEAAAKLIRFACLKSANVYLE
jgi:hypothetical protein